MNLSRLGIQLALAACVFFALNVGVRRLADNSMPRQLLRHGGRSEPATDLFLGNSTMAAGLDEGAFSDARPGSRPLNLALGATKPVEHYLIYRRQDRHAGATLYYGVLDTQLTDPPDGGWDALTGNRAMAYYVDPGAAAGLYFPDEPVQRNAFLVAARVPVLVERSAIWAKVERVRRSLGAVGLPEKETNRFGRADDFALLEAEPGAFARRCADLVARDAPLAPAVRELFGQARERGAAIRVVEVPVTESHRRRFYETPAWAAYREHVARRVREAGGDYVSAVDWIGDDGFADHLHLNATGARAFSVRLAGEKK